MTTTVIRQERGANLLLRAVYFLVFGLWYSAIWASTAWVLCVTIIGLPFGLWMLNRLPQVTTLRPQRGDLLLTASGEVQRIGIPQRNPLLRALWFVLVGWWLSALWMAAAWALCTVIIGLPVGFWMFDRVPAVVTLGRS